jgi:large conductance mechanosensitive channel protein
MTGKEKAEKLGKDFLAFAMKGNIMELAVGVMIGGAFGKIVSSLVSDIVMPLISMLTGGIDLTGMFLALDFKTYPSLDAAKAAGAATLNYGSFLQTVIDFLIIAACIFAFLRIVNKMFAKKEAAQPTKPAPICPHCKMEVKEGADRCPYCTSEL